MRYFVAMMRSAYGELGPTAVLAERIFRCADWPTELRLASVWRLGPASADPVMTLHPSANIAERSAITLGQR